MLTERDLTELLHDAQLTALVWEPEEGRLCLRLECLRYGTDDTALPDRHVALRLSGVETIGVGYDSSALDQRPSELALPSLLSEAQLRTWTLPPSEVYLSVNSRQAIEDALTSARLDWFWGGEALFLSRPYRLCLSLDERPLGLRAKVVLLVGYETLAVFDPETPLSLETWADQYNAWWKHWEEHWAQKEGDDEGEKREEECKDAEEESEEDDLAERLIPTGGSEPADLSYRPPAAPAFDLAPGHAPEELLIPLRDWFEGHMTEDWSRMAKAWPHLDLSLEERAEEIRKAKQGDEHGRWGYARSVDRWWQEGRRACVVLRGIEHEMAFEEYPTENKECVWKFSLRRQGDSWAIRSYSQGWTTHGSAPSLPAERKPWLLRWRGGPILS